jgi:putative ABC transport system ATP-binding protein
MRWQSPRSSEPKAAPTTGAAVRLEALRFRWGSGQHPVLVIDELRVARGERVYVEGPSGSGKSTLLALLAGVAVPEAGEVEVLGKRLDRLSAAGRDRFRAHHIGYMFQQFNLIPYLSMVENVLLPCRFSRQRRTAVRRRSSTLEAEALRLLAHLDLGDEVLRSRPVTALSVGQQQRVAVARALRGSPGLVIADEPTSALDADRRESFLRLLFAECAESGATLVFVSHDAALERLFDRTLRLAELNRAASHPSPAA